MLTENIYPKLIMTKTCDILKLYCKNRGLKKISEICISNCPPYCIKDVNTLCLALYKGNGVEDLKYSWSAHKSKPNRW